MKEYTVRKVCVFVGGFAVGFLIGAIADPAMRDSGFHKDAIAHHAAHYDSKTGKWQWNEELE